MLVQPHAHGIDDDGLFDARIRRRQSQHNGQRRQIARGRDRLRGANPPDQLVARRITIGVFDRKLRLAHAAQPMHGGLRQRQRFLAG